MATLPEVQVELYVSGTGPRHSFKEKLQGWEANRLDLETIMNKYSLKALYAYSLSNGRGQRLIQHPRNGLSMVCYSGKPDVVIRLDSDPKVGGYRAISVFFHVKIMIDRALWFAVLFVSVRPLIAYEFSQQFCIAKKLVSWILGLVYELFSVKKKMDGIWMGLGV